MARNICQVLLVRKMVIVTVIVMCMTSDEEISVEGEPIVENGLRAVHGRPFEGRLPRFARPTCLLMMPPRGFQATWKNLHAPKGCFFYYFDDEVIDKLCEWMNIKANEYFTATGKKKVNGLLLLFLSLL